MQQRQRYKQACVFSGAAVTAIDKLRMLMRYTAWADARLFDTLAALPHDTPALAGMVKTLNHAYVVDLIWKAHLEGKPHGFRERNTETQPGLQQLREAQAGSDRWYIAYADGLSEAAHDATLSFRFVDGGAGAMTRGDMLLHVANHKTYHRGYVAQMLYDRGSRAPVMDLPVFFRDRPPEN
jgi:uncharacterized damage-inducible protein DinB